MKQKQNLAKMQLPSLECATFWPKLGLECALQVLAGKAPCMHRNLSKTAAALCICHYKSIEVRKTRLCSHLQLHTVCPIQIMLMLCKSHVKFCHVKPTWPCYRYTDRCLSACCSACANVHFYRFPFHANLVHTILKWENLLQSSNLIYWRIACSAGYFSVLPLLVAIAWPVQASVCDSHKVETQTALLFFIFSAPMYSWVDLHWTGIWRGQNVVNQLKNIFRYFVFCLASLQFS